MLHTVEECLKVKLRLETGRWENLLDLSDRNSPELSSRKRFLTDFWEVLFMTISLFVSVKDPELKEAL